MLGLGMEIVPASAAGLVAGPIAAPTITLIDSREDSPGASSAIAADTFVYNLDLPIGTLAFLVSSFRGISGITVGGVSATQVGSLFVTSDIDSAAFTFENTTSGIKEIVLSGTRTNVERFVSTYLVDGAASFSSGNVLPLSHNGAVMFQSLSINTAEAYVPEGGLTEHFNGDIRSGEWAYAGSASGDLALTEHTGYVGPHDDIYLAASAYPAAAFDPVTSLFGSGQLGFSLIPTMATLYQDAAGTTPVTGDGDPIGLALDNSGNGNHGTQTNAAQRPLYRTDGTYEWMEFDGVDDNLLIPSITATDSSLSVFTAHSLTTNAALQYLLDVETGRFTLHGAAGSTTEMGWTDPGGSHFVVNPPLGNKVVSFNGVGPSGVLREDGAEILSEVRTITAIDGAIRVGARYAPGGSGPFGGRIYGVVCRAADSTSELSDMEAYMAGLNGVTL